MLEPCPRLLIAGTAGDAGKTVITVGLARYFAGQGLAVAVFKKGPDYIDASWLSAATISRARNLDTYLVDEETVRRSFCNYAVQDGINLIEGNRGLHDGADVEGSHSSAALSKLIECPVILVQDVTKVTRSAAAFVLGSKVLDPGVNIQGVILNRVAGARHEKIVRQSIESLCRVPVLGALPKLGSADKVPSRHLGLITPQEESRNLELVERLGRMAAEHLDLPKILDIARSASPMQKEAAPFPKVQEKKKVRIAYLDDSAFSFYYPENLEGLEGLGAELIAVSALEAQELPPCDALYMGGGFPETHAPALAENRLFRESLFRAARSGLPIYGECGGLVYLGASLVWKGKSYPMTGVFPHTSRVEAKPQGHGYARFLVDHDNPFLAKGLEVKAHEFHYSHLEPGEAKTVFEVKRGTGCGQGRDGLLRWNTLGTYFHIHAMGCSAWARGVVSAAERYRKER